MEVTRTLRIVNIQGLHARPCHAIASTALGFRSELRVRSRGAEVDGKSIMELMTLSAGEGAELEVCARGDDAEELVGELEKLVASGFGEEIRD